MNRKFIEEKLKGKVSDDDLKILVDDLIEEHGNGVEDMKKELETTKEMVKTLTTENKNLKSDIKDRNTQLETLKNSSVDNESLKLQIEKLQSENASKDEEHLKEIAKLKLENAIDKELSNAKAKNIIAVKALLNLENVELNEDGTLKGLSEQIETLSKGEDTKFLFNETEQTFKGVTPGENGNKTPNQNVDFSKMSYEEIVKYYEENPNLQ